MSDLLLKIFGGALLGVMVMLILKKSNPDSALMLKLTVGIVLACACIAFLKPIVEYIIEISESFGATEQIMRSAEILLKALGVAVLTHICATVCRDSGEGSIAYYVELGGKIEIMLLSLPLLRNVTDMALELLELG